MNQDEIRCVAEVHEGKIYPHRETFQDIVEVIGAESIILFGMGDRRSGEMSLCLPRVVNSAFREGYSPSGEPFDPINLVRSEIETRMPYVRLLSADDERVAAGLLKACEVSLYAGVKAAEAIK